jgi:hypothetical protein
MGRVLIGLAVLWGMIGGAGGKSWAGDTERSRQTLRGVEGVYVLIEALEPEVERAGLTTQQLHTDVELRLRQAGIAVLTQEERRRTPGTPYLYVNVNVMPLSGGSPVFQITVELNQEASLKTDGSLATVATWSVMGLGSSGKTGLAFIRSSVRDRVDQFINAYLSVHPRPADATPSSTPPRRDRRR